MEIENANSHPIKVAITSEGDEMYANSHPYKVSVVEGGNELVSELPETGSKGTTYVLVDDVENPSKVYGIYLYDGNEWLLVAQPVDQAVEMVEELPEEGKEGVLYYVPKTGTDTYDLYRWINNTWIKVDTDITLYNQEGDNTDGAMTQAATTAMKGKPRELTTADYNWPLTGTKTGVAWWLLPTGLYHYERGITLWQTPGDADANGMTFLVNQDYDIPRRRTCMIALDANRWVNLESAHPLGFYVANVNGNTYTIQAFEIPMVNNLTSYSTKSGLSANQGRVLNDKIGGDLSNLNTTDKTSLINAINELVASGGITELTTADYNYPTDNPTSVALWLLDSGIYYTKSGVTVSNANGSQVSIASMFTVGERDTAFGTRTTTVSNYTGLEVRSVNDYGVDQGEIKKAVKVVQTTGTSNTDVMSQDAVTTMVFSPNENDYNRVGVNIQKSGTSASYSVRIGHGNNVYGSGVSIGWGKSGRNSISSGNVTIRGGGSGSSDKGARAQNGAIAIGDGNTDASGNYSVALGGGAVASNAYAIALGGGSNATMKGQMQIGLNDNSTNGYNDSQYRLLTGLYDGQSAHDAATYGQLSTAILNGGTTAPTTATVGAVGTLYSYVDTTGATPVPHLMVCTAIDDTDPQNITYTWAETGGGGGQTVVPLTDNELNNLWEEES